MMKFTESHEWVRIEENIATVGVTSYAQKELGDIVYIELPKIGQKVQCEQEAAVLESTKAAADIYSPISGEIVAVNETLKAAPETLNQSPENLGWIFKVKLSNPEELEGLMNLTQYQAMIK